MKNIPYFYEWLPQCYRVLKESSHIYLMTNMLNLKNMMIETEKA
jgi:DNA modification methylase